MGASLVNPAVRSLKWSEILDRVGGDEELILELIELFQSDLPASLSSLSEAITERDASQTRYLAHRLKGAAASFSHEPSVQCAQEIEDRAPMNEWIIIKRLFADLMCSANELSKELEKCPFRTTGRVN